VRFMLMMKADDAYEAGQPPDPALMTAMGPYVEKMAKSGVLIETGGLLPSARGTRVSLAAGAFTVTDGPFAETKELIGGYAIVEVPSKEEAIRITREFLQLHRDVLGPGYAGESEIREMMGVTHFAPVAA
jgi:hypothetical protein